MACHMFAESFLFLRIAFRQINKIKDDQTACQFESSFNRISQASLRFAFYRQAIDDNFNGVLLLLFQLGNIGDGIDNAIHANS